MFKIGCTQILEEFKTRFPEVYEDAEDDFSLIKTIKPDMRNIDPNYPALFSLLDKMGLDDHRLVCQNALDISMTRMILIPDILAGLKTLANEIDGFVWSSTHSGIPDDIIVRLQGIERSLRNFLKQSPIEMDAESTEFLDFESEIRDSSIDFQTNASIMQENYDELRKNHFLKYKTIIKYFREVLRDINIVHDKILLSQQYFGKAMKLYQIYKAYAPLILGFVEMESRLPNISSGITEEE